MQCQPGELVAVVGAISAGKVSKCIFCGTDIDSNTSIVVILFGNTCRIDLMYLICYYSLVHAINNVKLNDDYYF